VHGQQAGLGAKAEYGKRNATVGQMPIVENERIASKV
jgi:hypothetical protein